MKTIFPKKIMFFALCLYFGARPLAAQVTQQWTVAYGGAGNSTDGANSIAVDASGNVYVTGHIYSGIATGVDYATIKYNGSGVQQWVATYNGTANGVDVAASIKVDGSGNVYVTGYSEGTETDYATIKYNSSGVQQWVQLYTGIGNSGGQATSLAVDASGNVYVTGVSDGSGTGSDYATIKYNTSGVQQWVQRYNGPANDNEQATAITVDASGNVYVTGYSTVSGTNNDYATIKYNAAGIPQWVQRYNGPFGGVDEGYAIAVDGSGNVYVTGLSVGIGTDVDYATIKYNSSGVQQWVQRYNGPGNYIDQASSIALDNSGNIYVTGWSMGSGTAFDYATIKYNFSGVQQWVQRYNGTGGNGDERAYSITVDGLGNVYVAGWSTLSGINSDYATVKYNTAGVQEWAQRYNGQGNWIDEASSVAADASGNVYVTGASFVSGGGYDYVTIKYAPVALPVKLGSFKAVEQDASVLLEWTTLTEDNVKYYQVEKSDNGNSFTAIGIVNAKGNSAGNDYNFLDRNPWQGQNYYRLMMMDNDGRYEYSKIVTVRFNTNYIRRITILPNPVKSQYRIRFNAFESEIYRVQISNATGQLILQKTIHITQPDQVELMYVNSAMTAGMYWLTVYDKNNQKIGTEKIFIE